MKAKPSTNYPSDWNFSTLNSLNTRRSATINPKMFPEEQFEYYSIPAYQDRGIPFLTHGNDIESLKLLLEEGTLLFGKLNPRVEKVWRVGNYFDCRKIGSTEWIPILPANQVDSDFLYYLLWSEHVMPKAQSLVSGSTPSRQRVDPRAFYQIQVPIPPISEQRCITDVLLKVQTAIEQQAKLIALTNELKTTILNKLLTKGIYGEKQKNTEMGLIPESWEVLPLEKVASIERGKFGHRPRNAPQFYGGTIPFVQTGDVTNSDGRIETYTQTLNEEGLRISKMFPAGTILITIAANIGFTGILQFDSACPDSLIGLTPSHAMSVEFLEYYLETQRPKMDRMAPQGTQKNINIQFLKPWPVPVPSLAEQKEIAHCLNIIDWKRRLAEKQKMYLADLFRTLLHELMTAQIRVNNVDLVELS